MGTNHALLLDTNPFINLLDHYVAGDGRANENFALTSIHTIWARNHNFHVEKLEAAGFQGTAEELFQAAKMINEAEYQRVVFNEFADTLLGGLRSAGHPRLRATTIPSANAGISHEFAAAVYRFGHSLIGQTMTVLDADGNPTQVQSVRRLPQPEQRSGGVHRRRCLPATRRSRATRSTASTPSSAASSASRRRRSTSTSSTPSATIWCASTPTCSPSTSRAAGTSVSAR